MYKKKIGISQRLMHHPKYREIMTTLDYEWGFFLHKVNMLAIPIPLVDQREVPRMLKSLEIDGVILSGGNSCSKYMDKRDPSYYLSKKRDLFEKTLIEEAIRRQLPILGVCRGLQFINLYFGGTLGECKNHNGSHHQIYQISGKEKFRFSFVVNSFHNFSIPTKNLSSNFVSLALDSENNVEAAMHSKYEIYGIMWHPERNKPINKEDQVLIDRIFK